MRQDAISPYSPLTTVGRRLFPVLTLLWLMLPAVAHARAGRCGRYLWGIEHCMEDRDYTHVVYLDLGTPGLRFEPGTGHNGDGPNPAAWKGAQPLPEYDAVLAEPVWPAVALPRDQLEVVVTLRNTGRAAWHPEEGYALVNVNQQPLGSSDRLALPGSVAPDQTATWRLRLTAPGTPGTYRSEWQLHRNDAPIGPRVVVWVAVLPRELEGYRQQLDQLIQKARQTWEETRDKSQKELERQMKQLIRDLERELRRILEEQSRSLAERLRQALERQVDELRREMKRRLDEACGALLPAGGLILLAGGLALRHRRK